MLTVTWLMKTFTKSSGRLYLLVSDREIETGKQIERLRSRDRDRCTMLVVSDREIETDIQLGRLRSRDRDRYTEIVNISEITEQIEYEWSDSRSEIFSESDIGGLGARCFSDNNKRYLVGDNDREGQCSRVLGE